MGTAHGLILLFDHRQDLKRIMGTSIGTASPSLSPRGSLLRAAPVRVYVLGSCILPWHDADFEYGPVTAVDISETAESVWLACGHERGHVVIWDALSGRRYGYTRPSASRSENPHLVTDGRPTVVVYSVKTLDDIHTSAIVSLRFINDKGRLISIDLAVRRLLFQK